MCFSESFESLYNVKKMIGSGGFGRVFRGIRKFDGKKVNLTELYKHFALACIKTHFKQFTDGLILSTRCLNTVTVIETGFLCVQVAIKRIRKIDNDRYLNIVSWPKPECVWSCLSADYCS